MKSMTGFGRSSNRSAGASTVVTNVAASGVSLPELEISIRAVNGRYLEIRFHLPREYAGLESDFKTELSKTFSRGTLDIYVNRQTSTQKAEVGANTGLAKEYLAAFRQLGRDLQVEGEPRLEWLAKLPDVLAIRERAELTSEETSLVKVLLSEAAAACDLERLREGKALQTELEKHLNALEALSVQFEALKIEANAELEKRFRDRLKAGLEKYNLGGQVGGQLGAQFDDQRIAQEVVMQLDRADVSEELQRLKEHISAYRDLLKKPESQGKKLDFYAQELLREVNTIGSKSHITKLTGLVVDAKTLVERIREQVQNAE